MKIKENEDLKNPQIKISFDTLSINSRKTITGEIYFSIDDFFFPEQGWNDFVVVILSWWHNSLIKLIQGMNDCVYEFDFMEGPLFVKGTKISNEVIKLEFIKEKLDSKVVYYSCKSSIIQFKKTLLNATKQLLNEFKHRKWHSEDIEELEKMWNILNQ